jgi:hypothetical protein
LCHDACVIVLAERLRAPAIVTLDRRHFVAVRPRHRTEFVLLPTQGSNSKLAPYSQRWTAGGPGLTH